MASEAPQTGERGPLAWYPAPYSPHAEITRLNIEVVALKAHIAAHGMTPPPTSFAWAKGLPKQQVALVTILASRHPRFTHRIDLITVLPARDHAKADERDPRQISVQIAGIRKKLGPDVIEVSWGVGIRLSPAFWRTVMQAEPA